MRKTTSEVLRSGLVLTLMAVTITCSGCSGVLKETLRFNLPLPSDFTGRKLYPDAASARTDLVDFVGHIIKIKKNGEVEKGLERYVNGEPRVEVENPAASQSYYSKVTREFLSQAKFSYLVGLEGLIKENEALELSIREVVKVIIPAEKIAKRALIDAISLFKPTADEHICYVQSARLANLTYKKFKAAERGASGGVGDIFSAKGKTYFSDDASSVDYKVSIDCIPESMIRVLKRKGMSTTEEQAVIDEFFRSPPYLEGNGGMR